MKSPRLAHALAAGVAVLSMTATALVPAPAYAQFGFGGIVYDPSNYAQNVLTAARTLEQINNQIRQLQNQATSLINEARNLTSLPTSVLEPLQQQIRQTQQLLSQAQRISYDVQQIEREFERQYSGRNLTGSQRDMVQGAEERWKNSVAAFEDALKVQAGAVSNIEGARSSVQTLVTASQSATGALQAAQAGILVKPVRPDIATNLVINTDRRTYHLELRANPSVYMASVSWTYPQDELIALRQAQAEAERAAPIAAGMDLSLLNFRYKIDGDRTDWRPLRVFDDGTRVFIEFAEGVAQGELPPLFVIGAGGEAELVNYRVSGRFMIVDRLFDWAELRLGNRRGQKTVRITRVQSNSGRRGRA